jgi:hypothetical protein
MAARLFEWDTFKITGLGITKAKKPEHPYEIDERNKTQNDRRHGG